MNPWLDFLLVILALGAGWLGWVLISQVQAVLPERSWQRSVRNGRTIARESSPEQAAAGVQRQAGAPEP